MCQNQFQKFALEENLEDVLAHAVRWKENSKQEKYAFKYAAENDPDAKI